MADHVITPCPEAEALGKELITKHHSFLRDTPIVYLRTTQQRKSKGKLVMASIARMTSLARYFAAAGGSEAEAEKFVLLVDAAQWASLKPDQRKALIDEQLCHLSVDDEGNDIVLIGYEAQLFPENVKRFGAWHPALKDAIEALAQGQFDFALPDAGDDEEEDDAGPADLAPLFSDEPVPGQRQTVAAR